MKNALILHGSGAGSKDNWFPWLKTELESRDWNVWCPDLPRSGEPDFDRYRHHIFSNRTWRFDKDTVVVGHSSGGTFALKMLQRIPENTQIAKCTTVGSFWKNCGWRYVRGLFRERFNFTMIKSRAKKFIIFHSDDDPYVPLSHAIYLKKKLNAQLALMKRQGHFNLEKGTQYRQFPKLLEKIIE